MNGQKQPIDYATASMAENDASIAAEKAEAVRTFEEDPSGFLEALMQEAAYRHLELVRDIEPDALRLGYEAPGSRTSRAGPRVTSFQRPRSGLVRSTARWRARSSSPSTTRQVSGTRGSRDTRRTRPMPRSCPATTHFGELYGALLPSWRTMTMTTPDLADTD